MVDAPRFVESSSAAGIQTSKQTQFFWPLPPPRRTIRVAGETPSHRSEEHANKSPDSTSATKTLAQRFELRHRISTSYGRIEYWKAWHRDLRIDVVVKLLPADVADEEVRKRFYREAQALASAGHRHVVHIYDVGRLEDGTVYMVLEVLPGLRLADILAVSGPLPWPTTRRIVAQLAEALGTCHANGVIHRAVEPQTVMINIRHGRLECRLTEFNLAAFVDDDTGATVSSSTSSGDRPPHVSPEQRSGDPGDARSDIYGLGYVMYRCLTGCSPLGDESPNDRFTPPAWEELRFAGSEGARVEAMVRKALAFEAEERYTSVDEFAQALTETTSTMSVRLARAPSRLTESSALAVALTILGFGILAGAVVLTVL